MTSTSQQEILLYEAKKDERWIVYWLSDSSILGITNFAELAYEINLNIQERTKLMGNIAESLLKDKWSNTFKSKSFVIERCNEESALLTYVTRPVEVPRIVDKDKVVDANRKLFFSVYSMFRDVQQQNSQDKRIKRSPSRLNSTNAPLKKTKWNQPKSVNKRKPGDYIVTGPICFGNNLKENDNSNENI